MATLHELMLVRDAFNRLSDTTKITPYVDTLNINAEQLGSVGINSLYQSEVLKIKSGIKEIENSLLNISRSKITMIEIIEAAIKDCTAKFNNDDYEGIMNKTHAIQVREQRVDNISAEVETRVSDTLKTYVNWQYPCLEIGPNKGKWTQHLIGFEPLYVADTHNSFLLETIETFNPETQKRIRPYIIRDQKLDHLPQGQFGFIFSWGFFNYITLNGFKKYLPQIFNLLKPGGTFMFSYNNADIPRMARFADGFVRSYAPLSLLQPMVEYAGFELRRATDVDPSGSWLEITKPGELVSIKRHATLGEIVNINY